MPWKQVCTYARGQYMLWVCPCLSRSAVFRTVRKMIISVGLQGAGKSRTTFCLVIAVDSSWFRVESMTWSKPQYPACRPTFLLLDLVFYCSSVSFGFPFPVSCHLFYMFPVIFFSFHLHFQRKSKVWFSWSFSERGKCIWTESVSLMLGKWVSPASDGWHDRWSLLPFMDITWPEEPIIHGHYWSFPYF